MAYRTYRSKQYRRQFESDPDVGITHTSYALFYHATWAIKRRVPYITLAMRDNLQDLMRRKGLELEIRIYEIAINPEHVHIVFGTKPLHYLPEVIKEIKGSSARLTNKDGEYFVKWQRGYDIRTVSERNVQKAVQYVTDQDKHHSIVWE